nr:hypothetical protein [Tanacetum cinerariifolium]
MIRVLIVFRVSRGVTSSGDYKRNDSTTTRRPTGFSAPCPVDEIELAKQKAQEIGARFFDNAEAIRTKFENGGSGGYESDSKITSGRTDYGQKPVELTVSSESIAKAEELIRDVLAEAEAGRSGVVSRWLPGQQGIPTPELRLFFDGRRLEDSHNCADYNIQKDDVIHAALNLGGWRWGKGLKI